MKRLDAKLLDDIVTRLTAEFAPEQIILFGSFAWGEPTNDSDIDLCVIVSESRERPIERMHRARRALSGIHFPKDVLVKISDEFNRAATVKASIAYKMKHEGKLLYDRSGAAHRASMAEKIAK